jgi:hypothetical protein
LTAFRAAATVKSSAAHIRRLARVFLTVKEKGFAMPRFRKAALAAAALALVAVAPSATALATPAAAPAPATEAGRIAQSIAGVWYHDDGSVLTLVATQDGLLTGTYAPAVGDATGKFPVAGRFLPSPAAGTGVPISWTIDWQNATQNFHGVTASAGQFFAATGGHLFVQALTTTGTTANDIYRSTLVDHDSYTRTKPGQAATTADPWRSPIH